MTRGTTPRVTFNIPYDKVQIRYGYVTFRQNGENVIEKKTTDEGVGLFDKKIIIDFSQEDTLKLDAKTRGKVQIRLLLNDGSAVASNIITFDVGEILKGGEI